jgi:drug/metabolite transporter (DMT)-like permease
MVSFISSGAGLIALAALLWGLDGILRRSLYTLQPITIVFFEHLIGTIILLPFLVRIWGREKLTKNEWLAVVLVSLLSGVLGTLFFTTALAKVNYIPFSVVFLLQKLQPIFTMAFAALVLKERLTKHYFLWAALAIAAAYFVTFPGGHVNMGDGGGAAKAALFALLAAIAWASSTAFSRYALLKHSNTLITGLRFVLTTLIALPLVFALGAGSEISVINQDQLLKLVAIAFSTGMVALWIYYRGLKTTPASVSTIIELLFPLTAVVIDIFLYHTTLAPSQYVAAVVLLFAAYNVARLHRPTAQ